MSRQTPVSPEQLHGLPLDQVENERLDNTSVVGWIRLIATIIRDEAREKVTPSPIDECNKGSVQRTRN